MLTKNLKSLATACLLSTQLLTFSSAFAKGGSMDGGGGDPQSGRKEMLALEYINLKNDLIQFLPTVYNELVDAELRTILKQVPIESMREDIKATTYSLSDKCMDGVGMKHAASTEIGDNSASICFDLKELTFQKTTNAELLGLALHEHLHHFGFEDSQSLYLLISKVAALKARKDLLALLPAGDDQLDSSVRGHVTLWSSFHVLGQLSERLEFRNAGKQNIVELPVMQSEIKNSLAMFTISLDQVLVNARGASRKNSTLNYQQAIAALMQEGARNNKNFKWLSNELTKLYKFYGE